MFKKNFKNHIIYQIYTSSFKDSNQDGVGDLNGIIEKLDYLKSLHVDLLWISPFLKSPKYDNGYDISNYYEVDPIFGTEKDLENLIVEAKKRGIGIMMDMVLNHSSTDHEWFQKALEGQKKYQDYYYFVQSENQPTNWQSKFGGSAWEYVEKLDLWYLHLFHKKQADLNWKNQNLRLEIYQIVNYWLKKGIQGIRFDVINLIAKPDQFCNDDQGDGRKFYTDGPGIHEYLRELNKNTFSQFSNIVTVGEMSSTSIENCIAYAHESGEELSMVFNFHHLKVDYKNNQKWELKPWDKKALKHIIIEWQEKMQANNSWMALFWNNHDQPRVNQRFGNIQNFWYESSTLFTSLSFLLRGTPYIYQGEEIGMINANFDSINQYRDVESINFYNILLKENKSETEILEILNQRSRDNSRIPFKWDQSLHNGFSTAQPWIPIKADDINLLEQISNPHSVWNYYQKIIKLRKNNPAFIDGKIKFYKSIDELLVFERSFNKSKYLCLFNLSETPQKYDFQKNKFQLILSNYHKTNNSLNLKPFEVKVLEFTHE